MTPTTTNSDWSPATCPACGSNRAMGTFLNKQVVRVPGCFGQSADRLIFDWRCVCTACGNRGDYHGSRWLRFPN